MGKNIVGIQRNGENSAHSQKMLESRHPRSCFVCMRARTHPKSVRIIKLGRISLRGPPISYVLTQEQAAALLGGGTRSYMWERNKLWAHGAGSKGEARSKYRGKRESAPWPGVMLH